MPYIADDKDKDQQAQAAPGQIQLSGGASTTESSGQSPTPAADSKGANTGSGYQNLDKYLQNNNTQQFAGQVAGKVQDQVNSAQQAQTDAAGKFKSQVAGSNQLTAENDINSAIANPTAADQTKIRKEATQTYGGPNSLADNASLNNQYWSGTKNAQNQAQNLGSESGRFALLDQYFGKPTYNSGQKSLDNLLIQQGGIGEQTSGLQSQAAQLQEQGQSQANQLASQAAARAGEVRDNAAMVQGKLTGALNQSRGTIDTGLAAANAARHDQYNQLQQNLGNKSLTDEQAKALGITDQNLYNMSGDQLKSFIHQGQDLTSGQYMSADQKAQLEALSGLAGETNTYGQGDSTADNAYGFDSAGYANAQQAGKNQMNTDYQNLLKNNINSGYSGFSGGAPVNMQGMSSGLQDLLNKYSGSLSGKNMDLNTLAGQLKGGT